MGFVIGAAVGAAIGYVVGRWGVSPFVEAYHAVVGFIKGPA